MTLSRAVALTSAAALSLTLAAAQPAEGAARAIPGTPCAAFPTDSVWHADIRSLPVHPRSGQWLAHMSPTRKVHPDFGPSYGAQPVPYGIPVTVVAGTHSKVGVHFDYASESDKGPYPLGSDTKIEGGSSAQGDRHAVIIDKSTCRLYETFATRRSGTSWYAGSGAIWNLKSNTLRPRGWTSADAAGLPILPGLLRYDEVAAGTVDHAIRFTTDKTNRAYLWPARHQAGSVSDASYPPMGSRFRLKAGYSLSGLRPDTQTVLRAMKTYGLILADNGSPWYFQGTSDNRWPSGLLDQLKRVPASAFEAVDESRLMTSPDSGAARRP
jgi:hypothetical protein